MKKFIIILFAVIILAGGGAPQADAALQAVSPANDPANGFPLWYQDTTGLQLAQCLDQNGFCTTIPPLVGPIVFPANFPDEFFYWSAVSIITDPGVDAILVLAMEAAFANAVVPGDQVTFGRIRIRLTPTVAGDYTITHPFGQITLTVPAGPGATTVTQDIGIAPGVFTGALADGNAGGIVNADGRSIGPFLLPADQGFVTDPATGNIYIAQPGVLHTVTGSPLGTNFFRIEGPGVNVTQTLFDLEGKVANCGAGNAAPVATADFGATPADQAVVVNVMANDTDNVAVNPASIAITAAAANGTAVRNLDGTVTYTPNAGFSGTDNFTYTVQDFCTLPSAPVTVPVVVERLVAGKAEFRPRTGKWSITGESSHPTVTLPAPAANVITLHRGSATGPIIGTAPVQADGTWKFQGKSKVPPGASPQDIHVESSATVKITKPLQVK